jgi:hypothetical protein
MRQIFLFSFLIFFGNRFFGSESRDVIINIKAMFGKKELVLEKEKYISPNGDTLCIDRFRFYLTGIKLNFENGISWSEKNSWHLIDITDSLAPKLILKNVPEGKITGLEFNLGIDSVTNVSGALDGDLDPVNGMYWSWNSGYINAKLEGRSRRCDTHKNIFEFHIGGYLPPHCAARKISLPLAGTSANITLIADAEAWFTNVDLAKTNSVVMPGAEAMKMADNYCKMFRTGN